MSETAPEVEAPADEPADDPETEESAIATARRRVGPERQGVGVFEQLIAGPYRPYGI